MTRAHSDTTITASALPRMIPVLILCLLAFGVMKLSRVGFGFSSAASAPIVALAAEGAAPVAAPDAAPAVVSQGDRLAELLNERSAALDRREAEIDTRERLLEATERRLEAVEAAVRESRTALAEAEREIEEGEIERFRALSTAYERMKPRDAAPIFEALGDDILEPIAAGMRTQALAGVLAEMQPEKARALTEKLAARARREAARGQTSDPGFEEESSAP